MSTQENVYTQISELNNKLITMQYKSALVAAKILNKKFMLLENNEIEKADLADELLNMVFQDFGITKINLN